MRIPWVLLATAPFLLVAGCTEDADDPALVECDGVDHLLRLYLGPDHTLTPNLPPSGVEVGNSFAGAFLTDDLKEWLSSSVQDTLLLTGNVKLVLWTESRGTPAPIVDAGTGEGYQFFNQFGSDRTLQPGYATQYDVPLASPGTQTRYVMSMPLGEGGFTLEAGDRFRLLLTDLALDSDSGSGHDILVGNPTASYLEVRARCKDGHTWGILDDRAHDIMLLGNGGLFTGQVQPREGFNTVTVPLDLRPDTMRLTIDLTQVQDNNPVKDDIDLEIVGADGVALWSIGSPYADEHGVLWEENLAFLRRENATGVRVNSYSGVAYEGRLTVTQEIATS